MFYLMFEKAHKNYDGIKHPILFWLCPYFNFHPKMELHILYFWKIYFSSVEILAIW